MRAASAVQPSKTLCRGCQHAGVSISSQHADHGLPSSPKATMKSADGSADLCLQTTTYLSVTLHKHAFSFVMQVLNIGGGRRSCDLVSGQPSVQNHARNQCTLCF